MYVVIFGGSFNKFYIRGYQMKRVMIWGIITAVLLCGCAPSAGSTADEAIPVMAVVTEAAAEPVTAPPTEAPTEPPSLDELAQAKYDRILSAEPSGYAKLENVKALNQLYGMQAGCEALALTAALSWFGYDLDIDDIVDDYLVYSDNFATGYVGNPRYFYDGAGIYPPGMVATAWNFIEANNAPLYPFDTTGLRMDELYRFVDAGCPVLVWTTYDRRSPYLQSGTVYHDIYYPWYDSEHCVCLCGYDEQDDTVLIADSWGGYTDWESASRLTDLYDEIGRFSMVLISTEDLV